jgi:putative oxidoreductase
MKVALTGLSRFDFFGVLILRIGVGGLIAYHGFPLWGEGTDTWERIGSSVSLIGITYFHLIFGIASVVIQSVGGLFLILGIFTRGIALLLSVIVGFALANLIIHSPEIDNVMVVYTQVNLALLSLVFIGPGRLSFDRRGV